MEQKNKILTGSLILLCSALVSCNQSKKSEELEVVPIESAYLHPTVLKASDYFKNIRYVALETNDHSLVGSDPTVWIADDKLIVISNQKQCLSFDKATGRFLGSIGHIGNDPEGSLSLSGWMNEASGHIYFSAGNGRNVIYDTNGNFLGSQHDLEITDGLYGIDTYDYLNDSILVEHLPATDKKPDRIILYQDSTLIASYSSKGEESSRLSGLMADIQDINMHKDTEIGYEAIYLSFKDGQKNCLIPSEQIFWHNGDDLFFRELFNDTVYQVKTTGLYPVRRFDFGSMSWDRKDRYDSEKDRAIYPLSVYENSRILWLRFVVNLHHKDQWKVYNAIYDKKTQNVKVAKLKEGVSDDLNDFIPLQPSFAASSGEFAQIVSAKDVKEWFEKYPEHKNLSEEIISLSKLTEEDNPVVIIME